MNAVLERPTIDLDIPAARRPRIKILNKCGQCYYYVVYQPGEQPKGTSHAIAFCHRQNLKNIEWPPEVLDDDLARRVFCKVCMIPGMLGCSYDRCPAAAGPR